MVISLTTSQKTETHIPNTLLLYSLYSAHKGVDFPGGLEGKASAYSVGGLGSIPRLVRSPREGNGKPLQYACLENPMDGGSW